MTAGEPQTKALPQSDMRDIQQTIKNLYEAYYSSDRITLFSCLDTEFQRLIPLNYFLIHQEFNAELGTLIEIGEVIPLNEGQAAVVCKSQQPKGVVEISLRLKKDYGGWRIKGNSVFRRKMW